MLSQAEAKDVHAAPHHHLNLPLQLPGFHQELSVESLSKRFRIGDPDACLSNVVKIAKQCGVPRVSRQQVVTYRAPQDSQATGQGSYGSVLLHCTLDKTERAVLKDFTDPALHRRLRYCAVELYMNTMAHLAAPTTVVPCLGYGAQICPDQSIYAFLIMKYGGETLTDFLTSRGSRIPIQAMRQLVIDLFRGISDLHAAGIVHGDLKGNNVLVQENLIDVGGHSLKIIDFGLSCFHRSDSKAPLPPVSLPSETWKPSHTAPESSFANKTTYSDIWACGGLAMQILMASRLSWKDMMKLANCSPVDNKRRFSPWKEDSSVSKQLTLLVNSCFDFNPAKRPTASKLHSTFNASRIQKCSAGKGVDPHERLVPGHFNTL